MASDDVSGTGPRPPKNLGAIVAGAVSACPSKHDSVSWRLIDKEVVMLEPGHLVEKGVIQCIVGRLKQAGVRYTFEDNRRR
jgi:hypothetical protein